jgi:hypothetical protein
MVTFELAIGILSAALVTAALVWGLFLVLLQARCAEAAAGIARCASRYDETCLAEAKSRAPSGSNIQIIESSAGVKVVVSAESRLGSIGPIRVSDTVSMPWEPR